MITFDRYVQSLAPNGADVPKCELSPPRTRAPEMSRKNLAALSFGTFLSLFAATAVAVYFGTSFLLLTHPWDEMPATRSKTAAATAVIPPAQTDTAAAATTVIPPAQTDTAAAATTVIPPAQTDAAAAATAVTSPAQPDTPAAATTETSPAQTDTAAAQLDTTAATTTETSRAQTDTAAAPTATTAAATAATPPAQTDTAAAQPDTAAAAPTETSPAQTDTAAAATASYSASSSAAAFPSRPRLSAAKIAKGATRHAQPATNKGIFLQQYRDARIRFLKQQQARLELQLTEPNLPSAKTTRLERQKAYWARAIRQMLALR